jgi:hypothetical protein
MRRLGLWAMALVLAGSPAFADDDVFSDGANGAKVHVASGFVCPAEIDRFDRDAVGMRNPQTDADYCAYSGRDGVYGTITLAPLHGGFDPKALMAPEFVVQEGTGGRMTSESTLYLGTKNALPVYARTYDAAKVEAMRYRVLFACAAVGSWTVEVTLEYADPRDLEAKNAFLNAVYAAAQAKFAPVVP